jgi:ferrochelatase
MGSVHRTAVVLIGHGSVERAEDIPAFVTAIRRGRPAPPAVIEEVVHRWNAIGGSPLQRIVEAQAAALRERLGLPVAVASRMWSPYARDVVAQLAKEGVTRVAAVPIAPYSVAIYDEVVAEACAAAGIACVGAAPWGEEPALVEAFAEVIAEAGTSEDATHVILSAHSLPRRVIAMGDTYEAEVRKTAALVFARASVPEVRAHVAFQSQGMDGGDWLGPNLPETFARIVASGGKRVVVCAMGFLADHTEILYDLDVEARAQAEALGLAFSRAASLNVRPRMLDALESVARATLASR